MHERPVLVLEECALALALSQHEHLGARSGMTLLDTDILENVFELVHDEQLLPLLPPKRGSICSGSTTSTSTGSPKPSCSSTATFTQETPNNTTRHARRLRQMADDQHNTR